MQRTIACRQIFPKITEKKLLKLELVAANCSKIKLLIYLFDFFSGGDS